jgi:hypothetical protein
MCDQQPAVNDAIVVQLTFDPDCFGYRQESFGRKVEPLFRDVYDLTQGRRFPLRDNPPSGYRHAKMVTLVRHGYSPSLG